MGAVYEGVQEALGRAVAIKVLHAAHGNLRQDQFARFQREARAAAALGHANIVQITDFQWVAGEPPFLVMEKLTGQSLGEAITRGGRLPPNRVAFIAAQALSALHAAHQAGIVHRDIKPDNLFLTVMAMVNDLVKVLDFGVAKLLDEAPITMAGAMVGSPAYMPPEQAFGRPVDGRADLYALGATMYHALSGVLPVDAKDAAEFLAKVEAPAVPLVQLVPGLDPALSHVVATAMAKRPEDRFPTAEAMRNALMPWAKPRSTTASEMVAQVPIRASVPPTFSQAPGFAQGSQAPGFAQGSQAPGFAQGPGFAQPSGFAPGMHAPQGFAPAATVPQASRAGLWIGLGLGGLVALVALAAVLMVLGKKPDAPPVAHAPSSSHASTEPVATVDPPVAPTPPPSVVPGEPPSPGPSAPATSRPRDAGGPQAQDAGAPRVITIAKSVSCWGPPRMPAVEPSMSIFSRQANMRCVSPAASCAMVQGPPNAASVTRTYTLQLDSGRRGIGSTSTNRLPCLAFDECIKTTALTSVFHGYAEAGLPITCSIVP